MSLYQRILWFSDTESKHEPISRERCIRISFINPVTYITALFINFLKIDYILCVSLWNKTYYTLLLFWLLGTFQENMNFPRVVLRNTWPLVNNIPRAHNNVLQCITQSLRSDLVRYSQRKYIIRPDWLKFDDNARIHIGMREPINCVTPLFELHRIMPILLL